MMPRLPRVSHGSSPEGGILTYTPLRLIRHVKQAIFGLGRHRVSGGAVRTLRPRVVCEVALRLSSYG